MSFQKSLDEGNCRVNKINKIPAGNTLIRAAVNGLSGGKNSDVTI